MPGDLLEGKRQAQAGTLGDRDIKRRVPANCRNRSRDFQAQAKGKQDAVNKFNDATSR